MARVRIGVLGCGAIAQVQHLPNLLELDEEFAVPMVCDVSPDQAAYVAKRFAIPRHVSTCLLYTSPSPRDGLLSRMPSSA